MRWNPESGHTPRGYVGASHNLSDVRLVVCMAEPGNPRADEWYDVEDASQAIQQVLSGVSGAITEGASAFHRNLRFILDCCWPGVPLTEQLQQPWITETTLCSAPVSTGSILRKVENECINRYLKAQLAIFSNPFKLALGRKAESRMRAAGVVPDFVARAAGLPMGHRVEAEKQWKEAGKAFRIYRKRPEREPKPGRNPSKGGRYAETQTVGSPCCSQSAMQEVSRGGS